jgi:hypothetical protein
MSSSSSMPARRGGTPAEADAPVGTPSGPWPPRRLGVPFSAHASAKAAVKPPVPPGEDAMPWAWAGEAPTAAASTGMKVTPGPGEMEGRLGGD